MPTLMEQCDCLGSALGARDGHTEEHCGRVELLCLELGRACGLNAAKLNLLRVAGKLHDVGKIGVPDGVLLKPGKLDPSELEIMKSHSIIGHQICATIPHKDAMAIALIVRHHHESVNGSGYPDDLVADQIPIESRVISVVDSYDAMTTTRPYHQSLPVSLVMEIIYNEVGTKHDPFVFDRFQKLMRGRTEPFLI